MDQRTRRTRIAEWAELIDETVPDTVLEESDGRGGGRWAARRREDRV